MFFKLSGGHSPTSLKAGPPSSDNFQIPLQQVLDLSGRPPGPVGPELFGSWKTITVSFVTLIAFDIIQASPNLHTQNFTGIISGS